MFIVAAPIGPSDPPEEEDDELDDDESDESEADDNEFSEPRSAMLVTSGPEATTVVNAGDVGSGGS